LGISLQQQSNVDFGYWYTDNCLYLGAKRRINTAGNYKISALDAFSDCSIINTDILQTSWGERSM
jgi:hypothetical protein